MASELQKRASAAIKVWCHKTGKNLINAPRHIHPRCYVVGYAAPKALIVARPWADSEQQCKGFDKQNGLDIVRTFDKDLKSGDWCTTAYVCCVDIQETVAIKVVE